MMNTKSKIYIIIIFFVLTAVSLLIFFVFPYFEKIRINSENLLIRKRNIAVFKAQATEVENFKKNYNDYKPNLEKIDQLFIDLKNPVGFIEFLEKISSDNEINSEISVSPYSLEKEEEEEEEREIFITFQVFSSGNFLKILEFTKALESGPYLIEIKNMTIKNSEKESLSKDSFSKKVEANFLIRVFAQL